MTRRELDHAIQSSFDGTLTEAACLDLREILKSDPAARALYYQYADLHQSLIFRISHFTRTDAARSVAVVRRKIQHRSTIRIAISAAAAVLIGMGVVLRLTSSRPHPHWPPFRRRPAASIPSNTWAATTISLPVS